MYRYEKGTHAQGRNIDSARRASTGRIIERGRGYSPVRVYRYVKDILIHSALASWGEFLSSLNGLHRGSVIPPSESRNYIEIDRRE